MKKKIIILGAVLLVLGIIGGGIGYYMYQKPVKNFAESTEDYKLTAIDLFNEFAKNEVAANQKYVVKDKTILVEGYLKDIKKNDDGTITVYFDVSSNDGSLSCTFSLEESAKIALNSLTKGKKISIKGQCSGMQELIEKEVIMIRCGLI
jgi:hypothetical protein